DLDHSGIGCDAEMIEPVIDGGPIALDDHRYPKLPGRGLDGSDEVEVVFQKSLGRHEHVNAAVSRLGTKRSANGSRDALTDGPVVAQLGGVRPARPAGSVGYRRDLLSPR